MPASLTAAYSYNPTTSLVTFTVNAFTSPATTTSVFHVRDAQPTPVYSGICTVAELDYFPTSPATAGADYRSDSATFMVSAEELQEAIDNVDAGLTKLCVGLDAAALGLVAGSFTSGG